MKGTVKFNVGGILYEVSRSLLEQHQNTMLNRMASETWYNQQEDAIFIERDGQRFRYVLDYMRDGKVCLPAGGQHGTTKSSILDELTYFGFEAIHPGRVQVEFLDFDAARYIARLTESFEKERADLVDRRNALNVQIASATVAHAFSIRRIGTSSSLVEFCNTSLACTGYISAQVVKKRNVHTQLDFQVIDAVQETSLTGNIEALNEALSKYGLCASSYKEISGEVRNTTNDNPALQIYKVTANIYSTVNR